ncbi:MAG: hypothetical protein ACPG77_14735 [Nannocystaceae bacterium]
MKAAANATGIPYGKIRRAKKLGCPAWRANGNIHEAELLAWMAEHMPNRDPASGNAGESVKLVEGEASEPGAASALSRLEMAEAVAHDHYVSLRDRLRSDPNGDVDEDEVSNALSAWSRLSTSLLSYETKIEDGKRNAGELIPKSEVVEIATCFVAWLRAALSDTLHGCVPKLAGVRTAREASALVDQQFRESVAMAVGYGERSGKLPGWMAEAAMSEAVDRGFVDLLFLKGFRDGAELTGEEVQVIDQLIKRLSDGS